MKDVFPSTEHVLMKLVEEIVRLHRCSLACLSIGLFLHILHTDNICISFTLPYTEHLVLHVHCPAPAKSNLISFLDNDTSIALITWLINLCICNESDGNNSDMSLAPNIPGSVDMKSIARRLSPLLMTRSCNSLKLVCQLLPLGGGIEVQVC